MRTWYGQHEFPDASSTEAFATRAHVMASISCLEVQPGHREATRQVHAAITAARCAHLYEGSSTPSIVSISADRGFANWPASLPTLMTGTPPPYIITTAICRSTLKESRTLLVLKFEKLSAQSPPARTLQVSAGHSEAPFLQHLCLCLEGAQPDFFLRYSKSNQPQAY